MMQDNKVALSDSLRAIAITIEDLRHTIRENESKVKILDISLDKLEAELKRQLSVQDRTVRDIQKLKNELEVIKASGRANDQAAASAVPSAVPSTAPSAVLSTDACSIVPVIAAPEVESLKQPIQTVLPQTSEHQPYDPGQSDLQKQVERIPVMQGSGFSHITLDYLKKLSEK